MTSDYGQLEAEYNALLANGRRVGRQTTEYGRIHGTLSNEYIILKKKHTQLINARMAVMNRILKMRHVVNDRSNGGATHDDVQSSRGATRGL